jgi:hypothetical protein
MIEIIDLIPSPNPDKRYRIIIKENGKMKSFDFGLNGANTYIDSGDKLKRENYWKRHCGNPIERQRILTNIPSPALFSAKLLWGNSSDLTNNIISLQREFNKTK